MATYGNGKSNGNGAKQYMSRKWFLTLLIVALATIGTFIPPMISAWVFGEPKPLVILSGAEWVSVIAMVAAAYIGGNVWQKREELKANASFSFSASANANANGNNTTSTPADATPDPKKELGEA